MIWYSAHEKNEIVMECFLWLWWNPAWKNARIIWHKLPTLIQIFKDNSITEVDRNNLTVEKLSNTLCLVFNKMISSVDAYKITLNEVSDADFIVQPQRVPITDQRVTFFPTVFRYLIFFRFAFTAWKRRQNTRFPSRLFRTIFNQRPCRFGLKRSKKIATGWRSGTNGGSYSSLISTLIF